MTTSVFYTNCEIFTADSTGMAEAMIVTGDRLAYVGSEETARRLAPAGSEEIDLKGQFVMPGFTDAHTHLVMMGDSIRKADLLNAKDLSDLQQIICKAAQGAPNEARVFARSWIPNIPQGAEPTRQMLDEVVPDRPVYLDSHDLHSMWLNTAALEELNITQYTPDPPGGHIARDSDGCPSGVLYETAVSSIAWPRLDKLTSNEQRDSSLAATFDHYLACGVTGAIDMACGESDLAALQRAQAEDGSLPIRVAAHWIIHRSESTEKELAQVQRAIELASSIQSPWLSIVGIKIILDGVIDTCTAAMKDPYAGGEKAEPIWDHNALYPIIAAADAANLQIAIHAIGDEASDIALDTLENAYIKNGPRKRCHRIEHLEVVTEQNVQRLASLGIIASMQPVHADPAIQDNWRAMLGDSRIERGYPWPEFTDAGATLALGTDAPTAPYPPLPNMYVASTRRSALNPSLPANLPKYALPLVDALVHATRDAAWSCSRGNDVGYLATGMFADFVVLDKNPLTLDSEALLDITVQQTVVSGSVRYSSY
jgi:predicted amidohydrolase YtcJ